MLLCIDLSRLYFAARALNVKIDYEALLARLRSSDTDRVIGFTTTNPTNYRQSKFIARLEELGMQVLSFSPDTPPSFTLEIALIAGRAPEQDITIVSDDPALIRVFRLLEEEGRRPRLAFFSERLTAQWVAGILPGHIPLFDLSDPEVKQAITV